MTSDELRRLIDDPNRVAGTYTIPDDLELAADMRLFAYLVNNASAICELMDAAERVMENRDNWHTTSSNALDELERSLAKLKAASTSDEV